MNFRMLQMTATTTTTATTRTTTTSTITCGNRKQRQIDKEIKREREKKQQKQIVPLHLAINFKLISNLTVRSHQYQLRSNQPAQDTTSRRLKPKAKRALSKRKSISISYRVYLLCFSVF